MNSVSTRRRRSLAVLAVSSVVACKGTTVTDVPVDVARIEVSQTTLSLAIGENTRVTAIPMSASGQSLTARAVDWRTSNAAVASVTPAGQITAVGAGNALVTAHAGNATGQVAVTVLANVTLTVTGGGNGNGVITGNGINCTVVGGTGSGTCAVTLPVGTAISLTAAAAPGFVLTGWTGACATTSTTCAFTLSGNRTATATFVPTPVAPTISNAASRLVELNSATLCPVNRASFFEFSFDYNDPNGNVSPGGSLIRFAFVRNPDGQNDNITVPGQRQGNTFVGKALVGFCLPFLTNSSYTITLSLIDDGGLTSNAITITLNRPAGAN
jgi:uncharacterized repeat protein (TIGR02543 family)